MPANFHDHETLESLSFHQLQMQRSQFDYLKSLLAFGPKQFIDNIHSPLSSIHIGGKILPFTISDDDCESSYVSSLYNQYIGYAREELPRKVSAPLKTISDSFLVFMGKILRSSKINKCLHVNNWLFSTNLTPEMSSRELKDLSHALIERYPKHAIVFRSVNNWNKETLNQFAAAGFFPMFSRQVYILDTKTDTPFQARHFKKDLKLLEESSYKVVTPSELTQSDSARIAELYQNLNIHKYSKQNPLFNSEFVAMAIQNQALRFTCLKKDGRIDAVYGAYDNGSMMVAPFFGYDTTLSEELGLYRQINALAILEAHQKGLTYNQSSGASEFKRRREAVPYLEFHMVYAQHLNSFRQTAWTAMRKYSNNVILPFAVKNKI